MCIRSKNLNLTKLSNLFPALKNTTTPTEHTCIMHANEQYEIYINRILKLTQLNRSRRVIRLTLIIQPKPAPGAYSKQFRTPKNPIPKYFHGHIASNRNIRLAQFVERITPFENDNFIVL